MAHASRTHRQRVQTFAPPPVLSPRDGQFISHISGFSFHLCLHRVASDELASSPQLFIFRTMPPSLIDRRPPPLI